MAVDEALLEEVGVHRSPPTLRLYAWSPPALSLGAHQDAAAVVNHSALDAAGVDLVRRPTGGRAVLHDAEVTYSVTLPLDDPSLPAGVLGSYRYLSGALAAGLRRLGLRAGLKAWEGSATGRSPACFAAPSWYELVVGRRKLVGSAQLRRQRALLQHGSILLRLDVGRLLSLLRWPDEAARQRENARLLEQAGALEPLLGRSLCWEEVATAVAAGFGEQLGVTLARGELTVEEQKRAEWLDRHKYATAAWTWERAVPGDRE